MGFYNQAYIQHKYLYRLEVLSIKSASVTKFAVEVQWDSKLHGLFGTAIPRDMQKIWIIGFFFEIGYIGSMSFGCAFIIIAC
jgi:hypothetical protein